MHLTPTLTKTDAIKAGFCPFTGPYKPEETWMIQNVISDMRRNNFAKTAIVPTKDGDEVWRILN